MDLKAIVSALTLAVLAVSPASAQLDPAVEAEAGRLWNQLPRQGDFLANPSATSWEAYGFSRAPNVVRAEGVPGGEALLVRQRKAGTNPYDTGVQVFSAFAVPRGHGVAAGFWVRMRKVPKGQSAAELPVLLQMTSEPYTAVAARNVFVGEEWRVLWIGGLTQQDFPARGLSLSVQTAGAAQEIEFGPSILVDLGPQPFSAIDLPADE